jgi:hypothetical protein
MKKLVYVFVASAMFTIASCGNSTEAVNVENDTVDTTVVDSLCDTLSVDSICTE